MNCENVSKGLIAYLDRRASSADRQEIERHLMLCVDCRARAEQFRALWGVMDEMPAIEPSYAFDSRVRERVAAEPASGWFAWLVPQPRLAISAAMLAVLAVWTVKTSPVKPIAPTAASIQQEDFNAIKNLDVLENYDVVTSMDALSELSPTGTLDNGIQNPKASTTAE